MENLYYILCAVALIGAVLAFVLVKFNQIKDHLKVKNVLLHLVIEAEEFYGSKKGKMKFDYVYGQLVVFFPWFKFIPKKLINKLVDSTLVKMREILKEQKNKV